jgi:hypothetical protein
MGFLGIQTERELGTLPCDRRANVLDVRLSDLSRDCRSVVSMAITDKLAANRGADRYTRSPTFW